MSAKDCDNPGYRSDTIADSLAELSGTIVAGARIAAATPVMAVAAAAALAPCPFGVGQAFAAGTAGIALAIAGGRK